MVCLVQQLFRQKVGEELEQGIIDNVLFPLLRLRKHPSKELLQDIKLTSDTLIITDYAQRDARHFSVPTFTQIPKYWAYIPWQPSGVPPVGKITSKVRRGKIRNEDWGAIDILNKLRGLNYPQVGYKPSSYVIEEPDSFDDAFIRLAEDNSLPAPQRAYLSNNAVLIDGRYQFVNNFLDDILITDKRLTYESGRPWGILSIVPSSQYGEVQSQLY